MGLNVKAILGALSVAVCLSPTAAVAEHDRYCMSLWVTRNAIFDRVGYCFDTPLGQALFDNSDCTATPGDLAPGDQADLADLRAMEQSAGCAIDTAAAPDAFGEDLAARFRDLFIIPITSPYESACIGYTGTPVRLYRGPSAEEGDVLFTIVEGQSVLYSHVPVNGWDYVTIHAEPGHGFVGHGWLSPEDRVFPNCEMAAG